MVLKIGSLYQIDHEIGVHPQLSLVKTMFLFQQLHFEKMLNLPITEGVLFGLSSGPGFLYQKDQNRKIAIGSSSLDSLQDLATSTGIWINRRFSLNEQQAISDMEQYLSVWKSPLLATIPQSFFPDAKSEEESTFRASYENPVSKCLVTSINDGVVECLIHTKKDPIIVDLIDFKRALAGYSNSWVDIIFPSKDISSTWLYGHSIDRQVHRWEAGWKSYGNPQNNMKAFFNDFADNSNPDEWVDTFAYADSLSGDLGRSWYASFLSTASLKLECYLLEEVSLMYKLLSNYWRICLEKMKQGYVDLHLNDTIFSLERKAIGKLAKRKRQGGRS